MYLKMGESRVPTLMRHCEESENTRPTRPQTPPRSQEASDGARDKYGISRRRETGERRKKSSRPYITERMDPGPNRHKVHRCYARHSTDSFARSLEHAATAARGDSKRTRLTRGLANTYKRRLPLFVLTR